MLVSINQPAYLPWLGYFHRIAISDVHIVLDHVQFEKNSFTNRNKIKNSNGECWLTVPVKTKGKFGDVSINSLEINNDINWRGKHWRTLSQNYSKAPFFEEHKDFFEILYQKKWNVLSDLCKEVFIYLLKALNINTSIQYSSSMEPRGVKNDLVLELCQKAKADIYISGPLGRDYINEVLFENQNIKLVYQDYKHPVYEQCYESEFAPYMAVLDLLFNHGPDSLAVLMKDNARKEDIKKV